MKLQSVKFFSLACLGVLASVAHETRASDDVGAVECEASFEERTGTLGNRRVLVEQDIYVGWRLFKSYCHACHLEEASQAVDSNLERDAQQYLVTKLETSAEKLTFPRFEEVVLQGRTKGQRWMPAWRNNALVARNTKQIYNYLLTRANCELPYLYNQRFSILE